MPGISGIISKGFIHGDEESRLYQMTDIMMHEAFYTKSFYINKGDGIFVSGVAIEDTFSDGMPFYSGNKKIIMFMTGECYVDQDINQSILNKFNSGQNDPHNIINLYEEYNEGFVELLNGWFNGIIIDLIRNHVFLFNDRYGIQRIYYHETSNFLFFSSEAKSILKILPSLRYFNKKSLGEYFTYNTALEFRSLFSEIYVLEPGSLWKKKGDRIYKSKYFSKADWENGNVLSSNTFFESLNEVFNNSLPNYFNGKELGMSLTGGLDTRTILACGCQSNNEFPCYTFTSMYNRSTDSIVAKKVSRICNQKHYDIVLDEAFLKDFSSNAQKSIFITDGLADVCKSDEIYMNKLAREIAPIRMTGKFGSQVIRYVSSLKERSANKSLINNDFSGYVDEGKETFSMYENLNPLSFMLFIEIPQYWAGFTTSEFSQLTVRSPYLDNKFVKLLYQAPQNFYISPEKDFQWELIKMKNKSLYGIETDKGLRGEYSSFLDYFKKMNYQIKNYVDIAYNRETLPFSSQHFFAKLDNAFKFISPQSLFAGHCGFRHYRLWFRNQLSTYLQDILLDERTLSRQHFNRKYIEYIVDRHVRGKGNHLADINKVLTIELINRYLLEEIDSF